MFFWDKENLNHIARHGISQQEAEQVIQNNPLDLERQIRNGEVRMLHLGETTGGRVLFVVVTMRDEMIRVVTAFPADKKARKFYADQKETNYGEKTQGS